jgi:hypothetical protein
MSHTIRHPFHVIVIVLLLVAGAAHSADNFPLRGREELSRHLPKAMVLEWKAALINADAAKDIAAIISTGEIPSDSYLPTQALIVLYGGPRGSFRLVAQTRHWVPHERVWHGIDIRRTSVFLKYGCNASCGNSISSGHHQFKETNGRLILIGEESVNYTNPTENGDSYGSSVNYLTRQVRHWRRSGKTGREIKLRFSEPQLSPLDSFDPAATDRLPKDARGYLDEMFRFVQY